MATSTKNQTNLIRYRDWFAAILLVSALIVAAARLTATDWVEDLSIILIITILGAIAGLALGYSRFSGLTAIFFSIIYGLFTVFWRLGETMSRSIPWSERFLSLAGRLEAAGTNLIQGLDIYDPILFLTAMGFLFWILSSHAGYSLFRHGDSWAAILPTGAALFIIHINDKFWPFRAWYLGLFLVIGLLLIARVTFLKHRQRWQKNRVRTPTYIGLDMARAALIAAVPLILIAWTAPALAKGLPAAQGEWQQIAQPVREQFDHMFASLKATVGIVADYYSDTLTLGRGNELSDLTVMTIEAPRLKPTGARYYWKARTYDYYGPNGWASTINSEEQITPDIFDQEIAISPYRWNAKITISPKIPLRTLHTVSETYSISRPGSASAVQNGDGSVDIHALEASPYLRAGEQYEIQAALTSASEVELREAGTDYPGWILDRYLQLPDTITPRTRELATQIVEGQDTPYDQAKAVTNFLRENIEYNERIAAPPADQERVDWLLFDYRQGFCNYYATAEIVLLRSLGIPARMAVGYAEGEGQAEIDIDAVPLDQQDLPLNELGSFLSDTNTYTIRQRELHAWPEVYFPSIGWVEFEPTANQLELFRPTGIDLAIDNSNQNADQETDPASLSALDNQEADTSDLLPELPVVTPQQAILRIVGQIVLIIGSIGILIFAAWGIRRRMPPEPISVQLEVNMRRIGITPPKFLTRWAYRASLSPLTKSYLEINKALRRLGVAPTQADTPAERVNSLTSILPAATDPANYLLSEYQAQIYSPHTPNGAENARTAGKQIRTLSIWAWFNRLISRWQEPSKKSQS